MLHFAHERPHSLLSKFSVTTDGFRGLRIKSASLEGTGGISIKPCRDPGSPVIVRTVLFLGTSTLTNATSQTILPLQNVNFLFKITKAPTPRASRPSPFARSRIRLTPRPLDSDSKAHLDLLLHPRRSVSRSFATGIGPGLTTLFGLRPRRASQGRSVWGFGRS